MGKGNTLDSNKPRVPTKAVSTSVIPLIVTPRKLVLFAPLNTDEGFSTQALTGILGSHN